MISGCRDIPDLHAAEEKECEKKHVTGDYDKSMKNYETSFLLNVLKETDENQSKAARLISITERKHRSRLTLLGIKSSREAS